MNPRMEEVRVGIIGLGNVGSGTLAILADNADQIAVKLGFRMKVAAVCSRTVASKSIPADAAADRRAVAAQSFLCLKSCGIFIA